MSASIAPPATNHITGDELLAMGDIGSCELIDGRIVPMSPTGGEHADLESELDLALRLFVRQYKLGRVLVGEVGIYTQRNPDRVRGADLAFFSKARLPGRAPKGFLEVAPELVVEIMSPEDRWAEVEQKVVEYCAIGVLWVWVVDPKSRTVSVYRSPTEVQKFAEGDTLVGEGVLQGFALLIADIFAL
jgi:Uma2 family endonuclease